MSTVDKMLIKGIRSFDPENKHAITFFRPLTLIVGPNGAGKTTIIECLKLSCTGELPPNPRSGHSFIHDAKVQGDTETKGQIKLRFKTAVGKDVVCIRSFQLTQKDSKMEFKAIESVLQTINPHTGEKVCLSYRCADMDREIPALMGVSKAILENVIFVHQDEANWPLQDPSTLKKKFDDIFSATRYTKALEVIKKLHKDQNHEINTCKLKLENLQTLKDAAYKLRENTAHDQEKTNSLKTQIRDLESNIRKMDTKIQQAESTLNDLRNFQEEISTKTNTRSTLSKLQQTQFGALKEENEVSIISKTDEELQEWQTKFEERNSFVESKISKLDREMNDTEFRRGCLSKAIKESTLEIGKLQHEADEQGKLKYKRDTSIQSLFQKHNLGSLPSIPFTDEVAIGFTNRVKTRIADLEKDIQDKKISNDSKLQLLWESYVAANMRYSSLEAQKQAKLTAKERVIKLIKDKECERENAEVQLSKYNLSCINEREKKMQIEIEKKMLQLEERNFAFNINQKQDELFSLEQKIVALKREKDVLAIDSDDRVKLDVKRMELEIRQKKHKKIIDDYKDKVRGMHKGRLSFDNDLKKEITKAVGTLKIEFDNLNSKSMDAEKEVKVLQMKIQDVKTDIAKFQKDTDEKKSFIDSKLQSLVQHSYYIDSFPQALHEAMETRDIRKSKYNIADGMRQMFDPFERVARAHHVCPCCERPLSAKEEDEFVKKQRVKATTSAEHLKVLASESSHAESLFQQLDKLRMVYEEYLKLGKETIPQAERNLKLLVEDLDQKSQALNDVLGTLAELKSERELAEGLIPPVEYADRLSSEMQILQQEVDNLEGKFRVRGQGFKSLEEIQLELITLHKTRDSLNDDRMKLWNKQKYMKSALSSIQNRWHALREEKAEALNILHGVKIADEDLDRLRKDKEQLDLDEKHLSEALIPLYREIEKLLRGHSELKSKHEQEFEELSKVKSSYHKEFESLLEITSKINAYNDPRKGERLRELSEKLSLYKSQLQKCKTKKDEISGELKKTKELRISQALLKRNVDDNLNYRKTKAEVDELAKEIESLEDRILKIGGVSTLEAELKKHQQERERLRSELDRSRGTLAVYESNILKNKLDLKQAQYSDIDKQHFDQLIQLKTTELANKDLDRYYNALDKALMRFHAMKMEEINKIIRELWRKTYRGQDIDYISIHSDSEGAGTRSFSYRVLMHTGDAQLEMRERCSAGQKVLASLIIRLALAETFSLHCGILALDEPTTNLDGPNAESLAVALLRIMEDRKGRENFQLIVITHDERFAQLICKGQHAEKYYRVTKNEHQHSIIEAKGMFD